MKLWLKSQRKIWENILHIGVYCNSIKILLIINISCILIPVFAKSSQDENLALGKRILFSIPPNYKLCTDAQDNFQLTDGKYINKPPYWNQKSVVGWDNIPSVQIKVDLEAIKTIRDVKINTVNSELASVYAPQRISVLLSDDDKTYRAVAEIDDAGFQQNKTVSIQKLTIGPINQSGRYVLINLIANGRFIFCDEIEIFEGVKDYINSRNINMDNLTQEQINNTNLVRHACTLKTIREDLEQLKNKLQNSNISNNVKMELYPEIEKLNIELHSGKYFMPSAGTINSLISEINKISSIINCTLYSDKKYIIWQNDTWGNISPYSGPNGKNDLQCHQINIAMLKNEYKNISFIISNTSEHDLSLWIKCEDICDKKGKKIATLELRHALFIESRDKGLVADPLPLLKEPLIVPQGQSRQIWIIIKTKQDIAADSYSSVIEIQPVQVQRNIPTQSITLNLQVYPLSFPDQTQSNNYAWGYLYSGRLFSEEKMAAVQDQTEHYINGFVIIGRDGVIPYPDIDENGNFKSVIDFTEFDKELNLYPKNTKRFFLYWDWGNERKNSQDFSDFKVGLKWMSPGWKKVFRIWLEKWVAHLKKLGFTYDNFAMYPMDEPDHGKKKQYFKELVPLIKEIDPNIKIFTTINLLDKYNSYEDIKEIAEYLDIVSINGKSLNSNEKKLSAFRKKGITMLGYNTFFACKSVPAYAFKSEFFRIFSFGLQGYGCWAYNHRIGNSVWNDFDGDRPDESFVYDGKSAPFETDEIIITSKRWEAYREGVQAYECLCMLRDTIYSAIGKNIDKTIIDQSTKLLKNEIEKVLKNDNNKNLADISTSIIIQEIIKLRQLMREVD